ncbi:unnamed protein product, partial [Ascophyllum nodosum]
VSIPDGTTTRETGSNCSWALVLVLQQNSTEKLNGHWWWCAPAADPHQKYSVFSAEQSRCGQNRYRYHIWCMRVLVEPTFFGRFLRCGRATVCSFTLLALVVCVAL